MEGEKKKIIFSGVQPTGKLNIGGYLGAVKNWVELQNDYNCIFSVVDLHSITVRQDPAELRKSALDMYTILLACGVDPEKSLMFFQSHVPQHSQLSWVLNCYTMFGELGRMTQFKDKSSKHADNINAGLFTYPVLMAADILLYNTDLVPVGEDQRQHLELCRDIANRFNGTYGNVFKIPEGYIPKVGARVMSLADPTSKMSKSDENENACVNLLDNKDTIMRKFKRAVTDSDSCVRYASGKDGINNLMSIYSAFTSRSFEEIEKEFDGRGYGDFKTAVGEAVAEKLCDIQEKYNSYLSDRAQLEAMYRQSAETASHFAERTMSKVYKKLGFVAK